MAAKPREATVLDQERSLAAAPPLYRVLLLNDDYTPMDFVVQVLERFFHMDREQATLTMLQVHNAGAGLAGIFPRDTAQTKVNQVTEHARSHQHPLQCVMEENR